MLQPDVLQNVNMNSKMNLKDMLKRDFGLELKIAGEYGQTRSEPIVVLDSDPVTAAMTTMQVLRAIGMGRGILWRTRASKMLNIGGACLEQITIETKEVTESEIVTQRESYYFDVSLAAINKKLLPRVVAVSDSKIKVDLPYEIGWLHYDRTIDNEPASPGLGLSIAYGAPGIKATIYLYDKERTDIPADTDASVVRDEFENSISVFMQLHPTASQLSGVLKSKTLLMQSFKTGSAITGVGLGALPGKFVKLRITHSEDPVLIDIVNQSVKVLQDIVAANT